MIHKFYAILGAWVVAATTVAALAAGCFVWVGCGVADDERPAAIESRMSSTAFLLLRLALARTTDDRLAAKYKAVADWLDSATPDEIAGPSHVIAFATPRERAGASQWAIYVRWVSLEPGANGIVLNADEGAAPFTFHMCLQDLVDNEAVSEHYILYTAKITQWDDLGPWTEFASLVRSRSFRVLLTMDGEVVSEPCDLLVLEVDSPAPDIETESPTE